MQERKTWSEKIPNEAAEQPRTQKERERGDHILIWHMNEFKGHSEDVIE